MAPPADGAQHSLAYGMRDARSLPGHRLPNTCQLWARMLRAGRGGSPLKKPHPGPVALPQRNVWACLATNLKSEFMKFVRFGLFRKYLPISGLLVNQILGDAASFWRAFTACALAPSTQAGTASRPGNNRSRSVLLASRPKVL